MRHKSKLKNIILCIFTLFVLMGCSSLLYYPDNVMYVDQEMLEFKPEDIILRINNKDEVHGWYFATTKKAKAVIIYFHGNGQNRTSHITNVYWLIKEGYDLFAPEYPGYGETSGSATPQNTVETGYAALRYAKLRNPKLPIVVYGQSLGGAIALRSVLDIKNEVPISLFIADSTFLSYRRIGQEVLAKSWFTWIIQWLPWILFSDEFAPGDRISELSPTPLLVIHDKNDPIIPFEFGNEIYNKAKEPKDIWALTEIQHGQPFHGEKGQINKKRLLEKLPK